MVNMMRSPFILFISRQENEFQELLSMGGLDLVIVIQPSRYTVPEVSGAAAIQG